MTDSTAPGCRARRDKIGAKLVGQDVTIVRDEILGQGIAFGLHTAPSICPVTRSGLDGLTHIVGGDHAQDFYKTGPRSLRTSTAWPHSVREFGVECPSAGRRAGLRGKIGLSGNRRAFLDLPLFPHAASAAPLMALPTSGPGAKPNRTGLPIVAESDVTSVTFSTGMRAPRAAICTMTVCAPLPDLRPGVPDDDVFDLVLPWISTRAHEFSW